MERLKNGNTKSQSRNKMVSMINLYEQYIDEPIENIRVWSSNIYLINDKWNVDVIQILNDRKTTLKNIII